MATPDLASLRNAKSMIEVIRHNRPNDAPPRLVLNQVGQPKRPEIPAKDFAETLGVEPAAVVNFDPLLFGQAANNGQMLIELQPNAAEQRTPSASSRRSSPAARRSRARSSLPRFCRSSTRRKKRA